MVISIIVLGGTVAHVVLHLGIGVIRFGESKFIYGFGPEFSLIFEYRKAGPRYVGPTYPDIQDPQFRGLDDVEGYNKALDEYKAKQRIWEAATPRSWSRRWMGFD